MTSLEDWETKEDWVNTDTHHDITFSVYRVIKEGYIFVQELGIGRNVVGTEATVEDVKTLIIPHVANYRENDTVTLYFAGDMMKDEALFYIDHGMLLPVFVDVILNTC